MLFLDSFLGIVDEIENVDDFSDFNDYLDENKNIMGPFFSTMDLYGSFNDSDGVLIEGALTAPAVFIVSEKVIFLVADSIASFSGQRRAKERKALERFRGIIKTSPQDL